MSSRENKQLIKQLHEHGYTGGPTGLSRYFARDYVDHSAWGDLAGLKATLEAFHASYPNTVWKIEDMVAEGDRVAARITIELQGAAGTFRTLGFMTIYRIENGKIAETWGYGDPIL